MANQLIWWNAIHRAQNLANFGKFAIRHLFSCSIFDKSFDIFRTPNNCSMYYTCSAKTNGRFYQTRLMCPAGFAYDITTEKCEPADRVNCKQMSVGELLNLYEFYKEERERKNCNGNNTNINSNIQSQIATQESQLEAQLTTLPDENGNALLRDDDP